MYTETPFPLCVGYPPPQPYFIRFNFSTHMLTGDLKSKIDQIWNAFWSGGIANPIEVIEQITYLLFLRGLDADQTREENKATRLKTSPVRIYPDGLDAKGRSFEDLRWSRFKDYAPSEMFIVLNEHVFPFLRSLNEAGGRSVAAHTTFAHHMKDARFTIPKIGRASCRERVCVPV